MDKSVAVALSGGVDSSVAAYLLKKDGFNVVGVTLLLNDECGKDNAKSCCSFEDIIVAKEVAEILKIDHFVLNNIELFSKSVKKYFVEEIEKGRTPSPCIFCNRFLKFDFLFKWAKEKGIDFIATGHYARVKVEDDKVSLLRGKDKNKDQSYFLFKVEDEILRKTLFPLGELSKDVVRKIAEDLKLPTSKKKESQDLCFGRGETLSNFLKREGVIEREGEIVFNGKVVGKHKGLSNFTVGQRRGIKIPYSEPLYVLKIDKENNIVFVGIKDELKIKRFKIEGWEFRNKEYKEVMDVQVRYRQKPKKAKIVGNFMEWIDETEVASPGQAVVGYDEDKVIGGGFVG